MMFVVKVKRLPWNISGLALWPLIFISKSTLQDPAVIRHERIHHAQQVELLVIPFYIAYLFQLFRNRYCRRQSWHDAYRNISFEREAYANDRDADYLWERPMWAFLKYRKKK